MADLTIQDAPQASAANLADRIPVSQGDGLAKTLTVQNTLDALNTTTAKTTPADADILGIWDSVAAFVTKNITWADIKTALRTIVGSVTITQSTTSAALTITQTGTGNALVVEDQSSDPSPTIIDASGNIITGHTAPLVQLAAATPRIQAHGTTLSAATISAANYNSSSSSYPTIQLTKSRSATPGAFGIVTTGDVAGAVFFGADDGAAYQRVGQIVCATTGTVAAGATPGVIQLATTPAGAASPTARMTIGANGGIHFGTSLSMGGSLGTYRFSGDLSGMTSNTPAASTTGVGIYMTSTIRSDVTSSAMGIAVALTTEAASFAVAELKCFYATLGTNGAGSSVTLAIGFYAGPTIGTQGTTAYGFRSALSSANANAWNCYMDGSASNYFNGRVLIGTLTANGAGAKLQTSDGITFPATAVASADPNTLDDYLEATYTATATGLTTSPTGTVSFTKVGNKITMNIPVITGASNATTFTLTGGATTMRPATQKTVVVRIQDNTGAVAFGVADIETTGTITIYKDAAKSAFTASGTKSIQAVSFSYTIV